PAAEPSQGTWTRFPRAILAVCPGGDQLTPGQLQLAVDLPCPFFRKQALAVCFQLGNAFLDLPAALQLRSGRQRDAQHGRPVGFGARVLKDVRTEEDARQSVVVL